MRSNWRAPWLQWLVLCITTQIHLTKAQAAVSTLLVPDTNTILAVNLPADSDDINFYISTPDWYQYTAIGFGSSMADALMLVMYASADGKSVTVSPRLSSGCTEPVWTRNVGITLHASSINDNADMTVNATCNGCRALGPALPSIKTSSAAPMMFAIGPSLVLNSDDLDARIRRHSAYGQFTMDLVKATGPGGIGLDTIGNISNISLSSSTILEGDAFHRDDDKAATAHGILYAIITLAVAPFDSLVAGVLGNKRGAAGWVHGVTASAYFAFVIGAMVPGVIVSRQHVATQQFRTGHQVLGLLTIVAMTIMFLWGIALSWIKRSAKKRGQEPPEGTQRLATVHRWACRLIWALLLINVGLGMQLSGQRLVLILAYVALALGLVVVLVPVYFCIWRCSKRQKEKEEGEHELTIYDHNYR
ncbi:uncharacterized protein B0T15DRAFT_509860 [Chaetomium strumarium]|uniref:Cellobiose dehydrogenase-like cytochrome domain-containing protein n=1 Tax=Chaetomium strumarium TaxID=1170767 RepID=A0AAJ0GUM2_9PEZI|nr:hypothetical protein B0T15DRAFT_509860 [Chaetomium strumarium]